MSVSPHSKIFVFVLGGFVTLAPAAIDMSLPAIPAIEATFPNAAGKGALTLTLFLFGFAVAPLVAGAISDRIGRKPVLLAGLAGFVCGAVVASSATEFLWLLAGRFIGGLGSGAIALLPISMIRDTSHGTEARVRLSIIVGVLGIAPVVAPIPGGWLIAFASWPTIFVAQAAAGLLLMLAAAVLVPETSPEERRRARLPVGQAYAKVLSNRTFLRFCAVFSLNFGAMFTFLSSTSTIFMQTYHLSSWAFSLAYSAIACGVMLGTTLSGVLGRAGRSVPEVITLGVAIMLIAIAALGVTSLAGVASPLSVAVCACAVFLSFGLIGPNATHESMRPFMHEAGIAAGFSRFAQMVSGAVGSGLVVALAGHLGSLWAAVVSMALFAVATTLAFFVVPASV